MPHDILAVLSRGLAITPLAMIPNVKKDFETSVKERMLYIILPTLHISLFSVLDAFINRYVLYFDKIFIQIIMNVHGL